MFSKIVVIWDKRALRNYSIFPIWKSFVKRGGSITKVFGFGVFKKVVFTCEQYLKNFWYIQKALQNRLNFFVSQCLKAQ